MYCGALQGVGVQAPPCNCWWHGVGSYKHVQWHPSMVLLAWVMLHLYHMCHGSFLTEDAVHSSMCSHGCLQNIFPWAAGHSCVQACCYPVVSSLVPAHWCWSAAGGAGVGGTHPIIPSPILAGNSQGHCGVLSAVCPAGHWWLSGLWCKTNDLLTIPSLGLGGRQLI